MKVPETEIGRLVKIDDTDLLIELSDRAPKTLPSFLVKGKTTFQDGAYRSVHYVLDHVGSDLEYVLAINSLHDEYDCKLFSKPEWYTPNHRRVLQDGEHGWLFDGDNYPTEIYNDGIVYTRKVAHEIFGKAAVIEWETPAKIVNYLLLLVENGIYNDGGGLVEFYEGRTIHADTVNL